jgi:hypothetical protein
MKKLKTLLYFFSALLALTIIYAGYELTLGGSSLFDAVKEVDLRTKGVESNKVLLSNVSYADYYVERWQTTICTQQISEQKYLLQATTSIWYCKSSEETHNTKECSVNEKEKTLCYINEKEFFTCKESWLLITK